MVGVKYFWPPKADQKSLETISTINLFEANWRNKVVLCVRNQKWKNLQYFENDVEV